MAKGKGKKKKEGESQAGDSQQQGPAQQAGPSQQQQAPPQPKQSQDGGKGDSKQQGQQKGGKKGQQQQAQQQPQQGGQQQQGRGQQQQQQGRGQQQGPPPAHQQRGGQQSQPHPQTQPQQTGKGQPQPTQGQPQQPAPQPQQAWGRGQAPGQPQGRGQGPPQQAQPVPPGFPQAQQQDQPQQPAPQQQAWGRGQGRGQPQGPPQQVPPGFTQGRQQGPPGFTQPQQTPTQQQQRGPPAQQQRGPAAQQQGGPPAQQQRGPPPQQQRGPPPQQRGPPPQQSGPPQQQRGPAQQQRGPAQQQRGPQGAPGPSGEALSRDFKKLQVAPIREDKGDDNLVAKVRFQPGKQGRVIKVESNHVSLNLGKLTQALHYDVAIDPDTPKKFLRPVMEAFRRKHFPNRYPAFDGKKNLYASKLLSSSPTDLLSDEISVQDGDREKKFKVQVKFANYVDLTPLKDLLNHPVTPREALQCVDIVLRSAPSMRLISVGRSFFTRPSQIIDLGQGMEMYSGFFQSTIRGWKPLLNVDVAHKAFPKEMRVIDALAEVISNPRYPMTADQLKELRSTEKDDFNKFMRTLRVVYMIPNQPGSKREYRVNQLWESASRATFTHEGRRMTVADYFRSVKHQPLRYPDLPTLHVGSMQREDKILLPMEFCTIMEGQALNRKMTENQTSTMIRYSATDTKRRKEKIMTGFNMAGYNESPSVREFGFSVGNEFQQLNARVLTPPDLQYNRSVARVSRGVWRTNDQFLVPVTIKRWTVRTVCQRPPRPDDLRKLVSDLNGAARACGVIFQSPPDEPYENIGPRQDLRTITEHFTKLKNYGYDVIFVVVPDSGTAYSFVKTAAEINVGCLTQCLKQTTLFKRMNAMTAGNILLKVNAKLAGTNHAIQKRPPIMNRPVMMMGADVTHPGPDSRDIPSVAAVTASHDPKAFQYNICWRLQPPTVEIIEDLENIMVEQLQFFESKNRCKPEAIVFFRDGVSEGQFDQVKQVEVSAIRRACKRMQKDGYEPKITFLVVQKRHHTRLFPKDSRDSEDKNCNVPAGTCVDTDITHPFMQDFYLVSHASIQGVAKPTKYCTLWDDNSMSNDDIEQLTYYLCHMFTRCNRSVSYPAPTYYAHLAAARGKVYIENVKLDMNRLQDEFRKYTIKEEIRKGLPMFFV